jgi:heterotetrameric sarcosine oxidase delta subunit
MMLLECPWCGPRNADEFAHVGEAPNRPDPATASAEQWRGYLYLSANPAGWVHEWWLHRGGCRRYLAATRDTLTNTVARTAPVVTDDAAGQRADGE